MAKAASFMSLVVARGSPVQPTFEEWASQYGFNGASDSMKMKYDENVKLIDELNAADNGAEFNVNVFAQYSRQEFRDTFLTYKNEPNSSLITKEIDTSSLKNTASGSKMWSHTPVRDQGTCGSCWAFGAVAGVEGGAMNQLGRSGLDLSEQYLLDCSGGGSCSGGHAVDALAALVGYDICTESSYRYTGSQGSCRSSCSAGGVRVSDVMQLSAPYSDSTLASALNEAALIMSVDADYWPYYTSGVLTGPATCAHNHAVYLVGYTDSYYKIKNSWGKSWGENGYIYLDRGAMTGCGLCGMLANNAYYPVMVSSSTAIAV